MEAVHKRSLSLVPFLLQVEYLLPHWTGQVDALTLNPVRDALVHWPTL